MSTITPTAAIHQPVLVQRCVELLAPALIPVERPVLVDATVGLGGHSEALLQRFPHLQIIGIDRDGEARALAGKRLSVFGSRIEIVAATYGQLAEILAERGLETVDGILADLGVSSLQLDETARGFAYAIPEAPLDMRMDQSRGITAAQFIATTSETEIARVLRTYGEEKFARQIARNIVKTREVTPLRTTGELVDLIRATIPAPARRHGGNPAKRTFQALRVAVNDELRDLEVFLTAALDALRVGGRLVVESYQSLEDRLVKQAFTPGIHPEVPRGLPVIPTGYEPWLQDLTRGAEKADALELQRNSRSQSVRLRAVAKLREMAPHEPKRTNPNPAPRRK
ncbi:16S rRNA (cytosine(1402)-N(4))-methyltransferase RsmH [Mobiluncus mulieris]|uniref:Ribosomal RNA small subunit methyltransferase H n=2 Tax=Mobiluncus mulieris TaxID=2052 RepID=E0QQZ2_9ACTO|nr:16S rRNA (cytosine(1402)-N(4))-methyltransferase RsmH [Mobiluncus mulieris]EFM45985.1 S-adenosyl-methyltransferase MraW [Mobiluncus mulieris ATCC 35239]MCU9970921.1 16S rRNA (cytosine(1402)-N(4))-methyltransferase RsmH [Mobiluncus mulieris]MCU9975326.1 16S rRNA (cytosine(1402)-N(4))-methyltransferase RsmH [Mobiluncus mulieris]MCU9993343.1 16S rRNA (cytosine(1402)-N(4))-methyltransferase RsmH [Mobiluncus mulieris]MCU9996924.1 16S rRNA (cytosine(1402)-N(4))-methyltransferase RsmH [Mobiluncus 